MSDDQTLVWKDGTRITIPVLDTADAGLSAATAVPRRLRAAVLVCEAGHVIGVATRTEPPALILAGDHYPSYILLDGAFQGVMTIGGSVGILALDKARLLVVCSDCDHTEFILTATDIQTLDEKVRGLTLRRADSDEARTR